MLKPWPEYEKLKEQNKPLPKLVTLAQEDIWHLPAYAQVEYIYDNHAIIKVEAATYHHTPMLDRVNQFDAMGPSYGPNITQITIEERLGKATQAAQEIITKETNIMRADGSLTGGKLMVIDALRTVDSAYLMAAANPIAVENKLLAPPGTSAHNKGMAIDLTLVYADETRDTEGVWCDADMLGHIDHPDMKTNHRNFAELANIQKHNRLYLEQVMLRGAFQSGILLAPLREEFWDFRFPEDSLDLWRVLEAIARAAYLDEQHNTCASVIEAIHTLLRAGSKVQAYATYTLDRSSYQAKCLELFDNDKARKMLENHLHITPEKLADLEFIFHGEIGLVFDEMLPAELCQANPELRHLFK